MRVEGIVLNEFGVRLLRARRARRWPMRVLAAQVGVSYQTIGRYETGKQYPRLEVLVKLAEALGVTVEDLVG